MKQFLLPRVAQVSPALASAPKLEITDRLDQCFRLCTVVLLPAGVAFASLLLWVAAAGLSRSGSPAAPGPITTVATVRAGLVHAPRAWVNRPVRMRAILDEACNVDLYGLDQTCRTLQPALFDAEATQGAAPFPAVVARQSPDLAFLHRVPLLNRLVPARQSLPWGSAAVYRVQLRAEAQPRCHATTCYEALLLGVAPGSP